MSFIVTWLFLAALWIGLSGYFDVVHLTFGFLSVTLVTALSHRHLTGGKPVGRSLARLARLVGYLPWLLWQILLANIDVTLRVLGFKPISPRVVRIRPDLRTNMGRVTLANSITLTPGTVTVELEGGEFIVHALSHEAAEALKTSEMEAKIRHVEGGTA